MIHFLFNCMKICKSFVNTMKKLMFLLRPLAFDVNKSLICGMKFQCQSSLQTTTVTVYTHIIQIFNGQQYAHSRTTYPVRMLSNLFLRSCISNRTIIVQRGSVVYWPRVFTLTIPHYTIHHYRISIFNRFHFPQFRTNLSETLHGREVC